MNKLITIDLGSLDREKPKNLIIGSNGELAKEAESELRKILDTQALLEEIVSYVKDLLSKEMAKNKLVKIKAGSITISRRQSGPRYRLTSGTKNDFINKVAYDTPNAESIDAFVTKHNELPSGVQLNERGDKVYIINRAEDE
jgi:hypothetical protein